MALGETYVQRAVSVSMSGDPSSKPIIHRMNGRLVRRATFESLSSQVDCIIAIAYMWSN